MQSSEYLPRIPLLLSFHVITSQVRIFSARTIHDQLRAAMVDYIRAAVSVNSHNKIVLPKLLDWSVNLNQAGWQFAGPVGRKGVKH